MTGTNPRVAPDLVRRHAPKPADLTNDVLFADVWQRADLSPRERSLITVAALVALGRDAQLTGHLHRALDSGLTTEEVAEAITLPQALGFARSGGTPCLLRRPARRHERHHRPGPGH